MADPSDQRASLRTARVLPRVFLLIVVALLAGCTEAPSAPVPTFDGFSETHAYASGTPYEKKFELIASTNVRFSVSFHSDPGTGARACNPVDSETPRVDLISPDGSIEISWELESLTVNVGQGSCGEYERVLLLDKGNWELRFSGRGYVAATVSATDER